MLPQELRTARLRLRKPIVSDAKTIFCAYAQDLDVCRYMVWKPHTSEKDTLLFIEDCIHAWDGSTHMPYILTKRDEDVAIGMLDARVLGSMVDIGYVLAKLHWGNGFMPEAIQALVQHVLSSESIFRVQATCDEENTLSQRALEKSGFNREGRLERFTIHPNISSKPRACYMQRVGRLHSNNSL
jgi:[ribosomal protein S5]-alanine N-acetyltransferase